MFTPRPYQIIGRDYLASHRHALLGDAPRVGKTPQAILAAHRIGADSVTVVCPAIAVPQWQAEFDRWSPGRPPRHLEVISYDRARLDRGRLAKEARDLLIIDECHFTKNPAAARAHVIWGKEQLAWRSDFVWALSGTPATKHAAELWPMLYAFGHTPLKYSDFVAEFCYSDPRTGRILGTRGARVPEIRDMLSQFMLRRTLKDVAPSLPPIQFNLLYVATGAIDLPESCLQATREAAEPPESRQEVALHKAIELAKVIQFNIERGLLEQTVVFGWHTAPLRLLAEALRQSGIEVSVLDGSTSQLNRQRTQMEFRGGRVQVICAQIIAAGTAIDLSAASHGYFLEQDWVPGNNFQAAQRLVALTKNTPVSYDVVTWAGSVDEAVQRVLLRRTRELRSLY